MSLLRFLVLALNFMDVVAEIEFQSFNFWAVSFVYCMIILITRLLSIIPLHVLLEINEGLCGWFYRVTIIKEDFCTNGVRRKLIRIKS